MAMINPFRFSAKQRSPFSLKRLGYWMSRLGGTRLQKDKSLRFVTINGHQFKRLVFCDSYLAVEIERNLECFRSAGIFPNIVIRYEREIWVEFVEGQLIRGIDEPLVEQMANFYSRLYSESPRLVETNKTIFPHRLDRDLTFLNQVGILSDGLVGEIRKSVDALQPKHCWIGFDYTDPVKKNFLFNSKTQLLCAVDVEGLVNEHLIGMGAAKALVRWLNPFKQEFLGLLATKGVPDVQSYYGFIELCFLAQWMKRAFFERDWKAIKPGYFDEYRRL
ncbi:MAG: hypothetical protein WBO24_14565 [Nitrospirales bacterium]